jgi:hypothetical protein
MPRPHGAVVSERSPRGDVPAMMSRLDGRLGPVMEKFSGPCVETLSERIFAIAGSQSLKPPPRLARLLYTPAP